MYFTQSKAWPFPAGLPLHFEDEVHMGVAVSSPQAVQHTRVTKTRIQLEYAGVEVASWERTTAGFEAFSANHREIMLEKLKCFSPTQLELAAEFSVSATPI